MIRLRHVCSVVGLAAALALLAAAPAHAQYSGTSRGMPPPVKRPNTQGQPTEVPPPALPGAQNSFAPAERTTTDLSPTDALFDAINRGDMAATRDAMNHGADLAGHNILGMTPLELSVDLGRNNITFLLLSLRGSATPASHPPATATAAPLAGATSPGGKMPAKPTPKLAALRPAPATVAQPVVARQFAGQADPGTPVPQAGFLGFGGTVQ